MANHKIQEYLKYAVLIATLLVTMLVASAFAVLAKEAAIRLRLGVHSASHVASIRLEQSRFQHRINTRALPPSTVS
ncbi:MAG: hypothetical protein DMG22_07120 [Acidobacteria bacterium]|nr:MAG: hypothetical protein DMG22_07120 [Acidobacteriota bacterium]